jgi:hypothetical protein
MLCCDLYAGWSARALCGRRQWRSALLPRTYSDSCSTQLYGLRQYTGSCTACGRHVLAVGRTVTAAPGQQ